MQKLKNNEARPKFTGSYKKKACIGEGKSVKFTVCDAGVWLSFTANTVLPGSIGHDSPELCKN